MTDTPAAPQTDLPGAPAFRRAALTSEQMYKLAARLDAQLTWTLDKDHVESEAAAPGAFLGTAPFGDFVLWRRKSDEMLVVHYVHGADAGVQGEFYMANEKSIDEAKRATTLRLVDLLNAARRDDPLLDEPTAEADAF